MTRFIALLLAVSLALAGCASPAPAPDTPTPQVETEVVREVVVERYTVTPNATETPAATPTQTPTATPTPTPEPTPTPPTPTPRVVTVTVTVEVTPEPTPEPTPTPEPSPTHAEMNLIVKTDKDEMHRINDPENNVSEVTIQVYNGHDYPVIAEIYWSAGVYENDTVKKVYEDTVDIPVGPEQSAHEVLVYDGEYGGELDTILTLRIDGVRYGG